MNRFVKNPLLQDEATLQALYQNLIATFETK